MLLIVTTLYVVLSMWIISFIFQHRKGTTCMVGMMASMSVGMISGLGIGASTALFFPGYFFEATACGMFAGALLGTLAGLPISLMAVLDGLLSGLMAGMMGTMLMVMVPPSHTNQALLLLAVIGSSVLFIVHLMLLHETRPQKNGWINQSWLLFTMICVFQVAALHQSRFVEKPRLHTHDGSPHRHESTNEESIPFQSQLYIKAEEFTFTPNTVEIKVNEKIKVTLDNQGSVEHDFEVVGTDIHIHAAPGQKNSGVIHFLKPGTYRAVCTLPGHQEAGMIALIHVRTP